MVNIDVRSALSGQLEDNRPLNNENKKARWDATKVQPCACLSTGMIRHMSVQWPQCLACVLLQSPH